MVRRDSVLVRCRRIVRLGGTMSEPRIYRVIRLRFHGKGRTIKSGLTLTEAQAHCGNPETSSSTCSDATKRRQPGRWFDGYDYMRGCKPKDGANA
jgi:hypothetical protein